MLSTAQMFSVPFAGPKPSKMIIPSEKDVAEAKANLEKINEMWKNQKTLWKDPKRLEKGRAMLRRAAWQNARLIRAAEEAKLDPDPTWPSEFHVLRIIAFVSERYELYTDYGQRIQARSPFTQTFTISICAQMHYHLGTAAHYLATERAFRNKGYQANASDNSNAPSPEGGQQMVDIAVKLLYELKGEDEPQRAAK